MSAQKNLLSIIVPVYNEEKTIGVVLDKLSNLEIKGVEKEIIVVDDGSSDKSKEIIIKRQKKIKELKFIEHKKNSGKGAAVFTGTNQAKGSLFIIQDADLEYNPNDIPRIIDPILKKDYQVVYGTRLRRMPHLSGEERRLQFLAHYFGNRYLSFVTSIFYGQWLTDMETCYKAFTKDAFSGIQLKSRTFDMEPEITAKFLKKGIKILEIDITTTPRGYEEGKKLHTFRDGFKALWTLVKYRFTD